MLCAKLRWLFVVISTMKGQKGVQKLPLVLFVPHEFTVRRKENEFDWAL